MEKDFWINKWKIGQIGFHQDRYSPFLVKYWPEFAKNKGKVFVPLCGKSLDMLFFLEMGHEVIGVEFCKMACTDFFVENNIEYSVKEADDFFIFTSDKVTLYCGDFFAMNKTMFDGVEYVYDRASLIALSPDLRIKYISRMQDYFTNTSYYLQTLEFDDANAGPPFSISERMVNEYFCGSFRITKLDDIMFKGDQIHIHKKTITYLQENVFKLIKK